MRALRALGTCDHLTGTKNVKRCSCRERSRKPCENAHSSSGISMNVLHCRRQRYSLTRSRKLRLKKQDARTGSSSTQTNAPFVWAVYVFAHLLSSSRAVAAALEAGVRPDGLPLARHCEVISVLLHLRVSGGGAKTLHDAENTAGHACVTETNVTYAHGWHLQKSTCCQASLTFNAPWCQMPAVSHPRPTLARAADNRAAQAHLVRLCAGVRNSLVCMRDIASVPL